MRFCERLLFSIFISLTVLASAVSAAERTEPVELYILIDKSLSMAEHNRMDEVKRWITENLVDQILIPGDRFVLYEFYGQTNKLLDVYPESTDDYARIKSAIQSIKPDGRFTDIGTALDTVKQDVEKSGGAFPVIFLLTDMIQEAPYSSRYQGMDKTFAENFLARDRIVPHGSWYEITVTTDGQEDVAKTGRTLYNIIISGGTDRTGMQQGTSE